MTSNLVGKAKQDWTKLANKAKIPKDIQDKVRARYDKQSPIIKPTKGDLNDRGQ